MSRRVDLKIVGGNQMNCSGCSSSVEFHLKMLPGVEEARANGETQEIQVKLSSEKADSEYLISSLDMIGYEAVVI